MRCSGVWGATRSLLDKAQRIEFMLIGASAGLIAVIVSNLLAWIISSELLDIGFRFNFSLATGVVLAGVVLMLLTGWLLLRQQQTLSPVHILRQT